MKAAATDKMWNLTADQWSSVLQTKEDPADVAKSGWDAMLKGEPSVIYGIKNKLQVAAASLMTDATTAKMHRNMAEPGSGT